MILSAAKIRRKLGKTVVIDPFDEAQLNPNSYDVRLGNWFYMLHWIGGQPCYFGPLHVPNNQPLVLPKGATILAMTKEFVGGQCDITTQIRAKSSTRRKGISICDDAGLGDVGYIDHWTMELTANSNYAVVRPGMKIAQIVFHTVDGADEPYVGQYRRRWPQNMIPKDLVNNVESIGQMYSPQVFLNLIADLTPAPQHEAIKAEAPASG